MTPGDDELPIEDPPPANAEPFPEPAPLLVIQPVIGYQLPRNRVAPPGLTEIVILTAWVLASLSCILPGVFGLIANAIEFFTGRWDGFPICPFCCLLIGGFMARLGFATWKDSRTRRRARAHVPRYCDRCGTVLTGLAVSRCPNCGHTHQDSSEAAAERLGQFADPGE
jgi:hypothetical protein